MDYEFRVLATFLPFRTLSASGRECRPRTGRMVAGKLPPNVKSR